MKGLDIMEEFAKKLRGIARRAEIFGHDRERILEELIYAAENYERVAATYAYASERYLPGFAAAKEEGEG